MSSRILELGRLPPAQASRALPSDRGGWIVFVGFLGACFIFGGGARADIASLLLLRPLSWLVAGYGLIISVSRAVKFPRMPLAFLLAICALLVLQLVPLPHALWAHLPGRDLIAQIDRDVGLHDNWRPLSLSPSRTANSLFAMGVPISISLLMAVLDAKRFDSVVWVLCVAGAASALIGLLQILGPDHSALYTYKIANFGTPTGLFANRNHQAIFLASLIPLFAYALLKLGDRINDRRRPLLTILLVSDGVLCLAIALATGSRSGAVLAIAATLVSLAVLYMVGYRVRGLSRRPLGRLAIPLAVLGLTAMAALMFVNSRAPGINRVFQASLADELRIRVLPVLWEMAKTYFPAGTGFGSFYLVYNIAEPHDLLQTSYLNQAHNDLLQSHYRRWGGCTFDRCCGACLVLMVRSEMLGHTSSLRQSASSYHSPGAVRMVVVSGYPCGESRRLSDAYARRYECRGDSGYLHLQGSISTK